MDVKKTISFTQEELQIILDFKEKILNTICETVTEDCVQCPFRGYCCRITGFAEVVSGSGSWTIKEEN